MTEKFTKELTKFFDWAKSSDIVVKDKNDNNIDWSFNMIVFKEPARNKLETFIKTVMDTYKIFEGQEEMDDNKLLTVKYKLNKPKRKSVKKQEETTVTKKRDTIKTTKTTKKRKQEKIEEEISDLVEKIDINKEQEQKQKQFKNDFDKTYNNNVPEPKIYKTQDSDLQLNETIERIKVNYKIDLTDVF